MHKEELGQQKIVFKTAQQAVLNFVTRGQNIVCLLKKKYYGQHTTKR